MATQELGKAVHIKTFGCQMNVYDSDRMLATLQKKGFYSEPNLAAADVVLINTCSIRAKSEQKVLSLLGQLRPLKQSRPGLVIGVSGCVGQRMGRSLLQRVPHLDLVLGPDSIDRVDTLVEAARERGARAVDTQMDAPGRTYSQPALVHQPKVSEVLTIVKGCDHFCTYCIVPFVRGREKSRPIAEVIEDVRKLVARGTREVVFLGQNINTYGKGTSENLAQLIEAANQVEGLLRIRYVTSHPRDLGPDLIAQFGTVEKLCPLLHLPFQSGSDRILKRMSRLYTKDQYLEKIRLLQAARPGIALSTDVIVGFPGETEEDFEKTLEVMRTVDFSMAYMFKYSPRPGTRAFAYTEDLVPESVQDERFQRLNAIALESVTRQNLAAVGTTTPVLVEALDRKGLFYSGRNPYGKVVHVMNAGEACLGKVVDVEITEANASNLRGYYVGAPRFDRGSENRLPASVSIA
jgi:tRNA-2-methylthio-N6-dimethylallyladenosine synthase